mgnify:CR=1 FL=1
MKKTKHLELSVKKTKHLELSEKIWLCVKKYLIKFPISAPQKWELLSTSYGKAVFTGAELADRKIVTSFQTETSSILAITDYNGKVLGEVVTPEGLGISSLYYNEIKKEFTFKLSSYS